MSICVEIFMVHRVHVEGRGRKTVTIVQLSTRFHLTIYLSLYRQDMYRAYIFVLYARKEVAIFLNI